MEQQHPTNTGAGGQQGDDQQHIGQSSQGNSASHDDGSTAASPKHTYTPDYSHFATKIVLPAHTLDLQDNYFLKLLAGSLSLQIDEKKRIIDSIPTLSQYQVDKLIEIFEEEIVKFMDLEERMKDQIEKLRAKQKADWEILEMQIDKEAKKNEDAQKAEEIRKQLGLS